jgi:hypothetical protein
MIENLPTIFRSRMSRNSLVALAGLALLAACDKELTVVQSTPSGVAFVTVANTTPNVVKPFYGSTQIGTSNLQAASWVQACADIPAGTSNVSYRALADTLIAKSADQNFAEGTRYSAILVQNGTTSSVVMAPETFTTLTQGFYGVRIVNATGQAGDFYITASNSQAIGASTLAATLQPNELTGGATGTGGYLTHSADTAFVRMYAAGTTTGQLASQNLASNSLTTNVTWTMGTTVVFTKDASGKIVTYTFGQCNP